MAVSSVLSAKKVNEKMSRPLQRTSSVRTPESKTRAVEDVPQTPPKRIQEEDEGERQRWRATRDVLITFFPHSIRLWMKQLFQELSPPPLQRTPQKLMQNGVRPVLPRTPETILSPTPNGIPLKTTTIEKASQPSLLCFWNPCFSPQPLPYTNSVSGAARNRNLVCLQIFTYTILCLISVCVIIAVLSSVRPGPSLTFSVKSYRVLQQAVLQELARGGIMGLGMVRPGELAVCGRGMENFVPCYNVTANAAAGYTGGDEFNRHCDVDSSSRLHCLIPVPKGYRLPLKWPESRDAIWLRNVKGTEDHLLPSVRRVKRSVLVESTQITFTGEAAQITDDYSQQIAVMLGLDNDTLFTHAGIRTVLDMGCCFGSLGAHFVSHNVMTLTLAPYTPSGGQVQMALERGLPAIVGTLTSSHQMPVPSFAFDMVHCAVEFQAEDGISLLEIDRILRPGGYFVWTSSPAQLQGSKRIHGNEKVAKEIHDLANRICWDKISRRGQTTIWQKTTDISCYTSRSRVIKPKTCEKGKFDADFAWDQKLLPCLAVGPKSRWHPVHEQPLWPDRLLLARSEASKNGILSEEQTDESHMWAATLKDYWTLFTPLIFSDHPKRPGDEDPLPPSNIVRNVMDMNAGYGGFNAALLLSGKPVWVMNVNPTSGPNTLPFIYDRGLVGITHDWCEAFPTYPRTYDLLHGVHLLSQEQQRAQPCGLSRLFLEMDRILRPEGWVLLRDDVGLIEDARVAAAQIHWEARIVEVPGDSEQRLLVCQKTFWKP